MSHRHHNHYHNHHHHYALFRSQQLELERLRKAQRRVSYFLQIIWGPKNEKSFFSGSSGEQRRRNFSPDYSKTKDQISLGEYLKPKNEHLSIFVVLMFILQSPQTTVGSGVKSRKVDSTSTSEVTSLTTKNNILQKDKWLWYYHDKYLKKLAIRNLLQHRPSPPSPSKSRSNLQGPFVCNSDSAHLWNLHSQILS